MGFLGSLFKVLFNVVVIVLVFAAFLVTPPDEFPDRLAVIDPSSHFLNNHYYADPQQAPWWDVTGPLSALQVLNFGRVPFITRQWKQLLTPDHIKHGSMLDVGCGGGIATEALALEGFNMVGVDIQENAIEAARAHAAEAAPDANVTYVVGSAYELPFNDNTFDGVLCSVFEHLGDVRSAIKEIHRVLKPGGVLVYETIGRSRKSYFLTIQMLQELLCLVPHGSHDWRMFINAEEVNRALSEVGFHSTAASAVGLEPTSLLEFAKFYWHHDLTRLKQPLWRETKDLSDFYMNYAVKA